jgi:hypothetical protein
MLKYNSAGPNVLIGHLTGVRIQQCQPNCFNCTPYKPFKFSNTRKRWKPIRDAQIHLGGELRLGGLQIPQGCDIPAERAVGKLIMCIMLAVLWGQDGNSRWPRNRGSERYLGVNPESEMPRTVLCMSIGCISPKSHCVQTPCRHTLCLPA